MASEVTKRDGSKEPVNGEKLRKSIQMAAQDAGLAPERAQQVVEAVSASAMELITGKDEVSTTEIREKILTELDAMESSVSAAWRKHDQEKKQQA
jgi:transcriptional regulator NrdR family protein